MLETPNYLSLISQELGWKGAQIQAVLELIAEGASVPFIARYRKEKTQNLDETNIRDIIQLQHKLETLYEAKNTALCTINEMGLLTEELSQAIRQAHSLKEVQDIYAPFKSKKKTKAMVALEKGFGIVADELKKNQLIIPKELLDAYSEEEIIDGSIEIVASQIAYLGELRQELMENIEASGRIEAKKKSAKMLEKLNDKTLQEVDKFQIYFEFDGKVSHLKSHQILALDRGENLGILHVKLQKDDDIKDASKRKLGSLWNLQTQWIEPLTEAFLRGFTSLFASVENELRSNLSDQAHDVSIHTFQTNLQALFMTKPEKKNALLAVDPGFRLGCKLAVLDGFGNPLHFQKIYLFEEQKARTILTEICQKFAIDTIVIGNGTACNETQQLCESVFSKDIFIVNESGASVYSVSKIAGEEFPTLDSLDRGTVSIGRRFLDPLSELVKVPVGSIGVGMYQHDIPETKLEEKLGFVVEDCVNDVGINVNTASIYLLGHISGIDKRQAKKIYQNRPYKNRAELKKVLGDKAYQQAIGFLRIPESPEAFDNSDIHPEQYALASYIISNNLLKYQDAMKELYPEVTQTTVDFIRKAYQELGKEKRILSTHTKARPPITLESLKQGEIREGTVRNVVAFGAFVDIGVKNDGLVHISELCDAYVKNPLDVLQVGEKVKVKILDINLQTQKIQLSIRQAK